MKLGIMQPYFFPYLGYWQLIYSVDTFVVYDDVNFIKRGWINRNNILVNGEKHLISLPLVHPSQNKKINQIFVCPEIEGRNRLVRTLEIAYKRAPYYHDVMNMIESLLLQDEMISQLNFHSIQAVCDYLEIGTKIVLSSEFAKRSELRGQERIIDICKLMGAKTYINAIGGQALYDPLTFLENGLELKFIKMGEIAYKQFDNVFVPNLSIIDILMFNGKSEIQNYLKDCTLL